MFLGCLENTTVPQHLPGHLWAKGKLAAPKLPGAVLWRKRGQWRVGSLGRKREPWLRIGTSGGRVVWPYAQRSAKRIGEVRWFPQDFLLQHCRPRPTTSVKTLRATHGSHGSKLLCIQSVAWCQAPLRENGINREIILKQPKISEIPRKGLHDIFR